MRDKFVVRYALAVVIAFAWTAFTSELYENSDPAFFAMLFGLLLWLCVALYIVFAFIVNLVQRRWRCAISNVVGPALAVAIITLAIYAGFDPEDVHFALVRHSFRAQLSSAPSDPTAFHIWPWGFKGGGIVVACERCIVFDPSGEMRLDPQRRSGEWFRHAEQAALGAKISFQNAFFPDVNGYYMRHVSVKDAGQDFYIVTQCQ